MTLATIDIGTHSVLLLIAEKSPDGSLKVLADEAMLTRIGEGMGSTHVFLPSGMQRTLDVLKRYRAICDRHGIEKIIAVGTAAFRKAQNAADFVRQVEKECVIKIEIIAGEREALLTWKAASTDFGENIAVVDIGGGSTEIITAQRAVSIPVGSVLLTEKFGQDAEKIGRAIGENLDALNLRTQAPIHPSTLVATAGTATTLGAIKKKMKVYKHNEIHGMKLSMADLQTIIADFKSKTIEERKKIPGLEPGRADVILAGSLLLEKITGRFGFQETTISDRGVRWGLAYEFFRLSTPATK